MSTPICDLETILRQMIAEHRRLLQHLEAQQAAMKAMDLTAMDEAGRAQEAVRLRIAALETRRRGIVSQIARSFKLRGEVTVATLAELHPQQKRSLLGMRDQLKAVIDEISTRTHVAGRLAGAVLGHLNTVVRLLAGAVEQAGVYTKQGVPQVSARIGSIEAVG